MQFIDDFLGNLWLKLMNLWRWLRNSEKFIKFHPKRSEILPTTQTFALTSSKFPLSRATWAWIWHFQPLSALQKRSEFTRDKRKIQDGHCCGPLRTLHCSHSCSFTNTTLLSADTCKELFHRQNFSNFHFFLAVDSARFDALAPPTPPTCSKTC